MERFKWEVLITKRSYYTHPLNAFEVELQQLAEEALTKNNEWLFVFIV